MFAGRSSCSERRLDTFRVSQFQRTIHLISRDVVETLAFILLWQRFPVQFCSLQQRQCTHHVSLSKGKRILDAAVHMAFSSQVNDAIHLFILHQLVECFEITNIHLHELIVRLVLNILQVRQVTRISQLIQANDVILRILVYKQAYHMATNKSGSAGNHNIFHFLVILNVVKNLNSSTTG